MGKNTDWAASHKVTNPIIITMPIWSTNNALKDRKPAEEDESALNDYQS